MWHNVPKMRNFKLHLECSAPIWDFLQSNITELGTVEWEVQKYRPRCAITSEVKGCVCQVYYTTLSTFEYEAFHNKRLKIS